MKLSEYIDLYHGGNIARFARAIGETPSLVHHWLNNGGYTVEPNRIVKVMRELPQSEIDHVKKVRES